MFLSIVIAAYNASHHIHHCLESLAEQTEKGFEIIMVVDSRSTDGSVEVAKSAESYGMDYRVIIQRDETRVGGARNIGLDSARGDYVWFLDVDDYFSPDYVKEMTKTIQQYGADIAVSNFYYSRKRQYIRPPDRNYEVVVQDNVEAMIELNDGRYSTNLFNKFVRRDFLISNGIRMSPRYCEDYEFLKDCFSHDCKAVYYDKPMYTYVLANGTRSYGEGNLIASEDLRIFGDIFEWAKGVDSDRASEVVDAGFVHILHTLTNADWNQYLSIIQSDLFREVEEKVNCNKTEVKLFKFSKRLFFTVGHLARKIKFTKKQMPYSKI